MISMGKQNHASATQGSFEHVGVLLAHMRLQWLLQHFPPRLVWAGRVSRCTQIADFELEGHFTAVKSRTTKTSPRINRG
jgi:hypothetical protein